MKKVIRMLLTAVISLTIVATFPASVFAYEYGEPNLDVMIQVEKVGEKEISFISAEDINRIRVSKSRAYRNKTDEERLEEIFVALKMGFNEQQLEEALKLVKITDIGAIRTSTVYLEVDEYGNQKQISEEEALVLSSVNNETQRSSETGTNGSYSMPEPIDSKDGYMRQTFSAIYTPHYGGTNAMVGRYVILGVCQWLKNPIWRMVDAISIGGDDFRWRKFHDDISNYNLYLTYEKVDFFNNGDTSTITTNTVEYDEDDANIDAYKGVYFSFQLPTNGANQDGSITCNDISCLITAIARVQDYNNSNQDIGISMRYAHTYFTLTTSISFEWLSDDPLVISTTPTVVSKYYDCSDGWDYAEHY